MFERALASRFRQVCRLPAQVAVLFRLPAKLATQKVGRRQAQDVLRLPI